jgi:sec-independent protein translocase protein TatB
MFDIGFQELVIIFVVALLVFGPEKLPEVGRTLAKWMIEIRKGIQTAKVQMQSEFSELEKKADTESAALYPVEENTAEKKSPSEEDKEKV